MPMTVPDEKATLRASPMEVRAASVVRTLAVVAVRMPANPAITGFVGSASMALRMAASASWVLPALRCRLLMPKYAIPALIPCPYFKASRKYCIAWSVFPCSPSTLARPIRAVVLRGSRRSACVYACAALARSFLWTWIEPMPAQASAGS